MHNTVRQAFVRAEIKHKTYDQLTKELEDIRKSINEKYE